MVVGGGGGGWWWVYRANTNTALDELELELARACQFFRKSWDEADEWMKSKILKTGSSVVEAAFMYE